MSGRSGGRTNTSSGGGGGSGGGTRGGGSGSRSGRSGAGGGRGNGVANAGGGRRGGGSQAGRSDGGRQPPPKNSDRSGGAGDQGGGKGGRGGSAGGGGGSRRQRSRGGGGGGGGGAVSVEQKRKLEIERKREEDEERKAAEDSAAEAAEAAAVLAEEEKKRRAEIAAESVRRRVLQNQYEQTVQNAITSLESFVTASKRRSDCREKLSPHVRPPSPSSTEPPSNSTTIISPLQSSRNEFELSKKNLKSDLKKCTAFVKRIKAGQYPTPSELELPNNAIKTLNLTRYVEEVAAALMEPTTKVKQGDIPGIVMLCVEMHRRYQTFAETLIPSLLSMISSGSTGGGGGGGGDYDGEGGMPRRTCFRLLIEFILHGIVTDLKPIIKLINEASGVPSDENKDYAVTDANMIVTLAKVGGHEILGVVPKSVKKDMEQLVLQLGGRGEDNLVTTPEATSAVAPTPVKEANSSVTATAAAAAATVVTVKDKCDNSQNQDCKSHSSSVSKPSVQETIDLQTPFVAILSNDLRNKIQLSLDAFNSTIPYSRAVPPATSTLLHKHTLGAYRTLSNSYIATHRRLLKLEKRCEQDRLLQGTLSDSREKGLADARSLMESLTKSVEALAESLDVNAPVLDAEELSNSESSDGKGIELWSGNETDVGNENLGPFDDEETRRFYCNLPDLLSTKPPALLGISANEYEKMKERNLRVYGENIGEEEEEVESSEMEEDIVDDASMGEEEEGGDQDGRMDDAGDDGEKDGIEGNKDSPGYKLTTLLEQDLPEATRRETIDELAERFCVNHGSNKNSRKRLYKTLFLVPRTRLDLLPYYSRFATILDQVYSDSTLVSELESQMHGQATFKNTNLESRLRTVRYLGELTKFRVAPPMVILRGLRRCLEDFSGYNIEVACCILESCGRYLYRMKHTHSRIKALMETMMRMKKARNLDERQTAMIMSAFLMVNPPAQNSRPQKEVPPLEAYLRHLLLTRLEPNDKSVSFVSNQIQRMPWSDPGIDCGTLVTKYMLKACRRGRYNTTKAIAALAVNLKRSKPEVTARLIDDVLEEIEWFIRHPSFRDHQRTLVCARLLGELYCEGVISSSILFDEVQHIINFGHNIPDALRQASMNQELFLPRGDVSKTILEDEELEDEENSDQEIEVEKNQQPVIIPVSPFSKFDPRVPSDIDPPTAAFRIKLVCTILETASTHVVSAINKTKLEFCLASLQRYLFTKKLLPTDVEFSILDLFDTLDSYLKKSSQVDGKRKETTVAAAAFTLVRYHSWLDAHQFVFDAERNRRLDKARDRARVLAQAGLLGTSEGALLDEDEESTVISEAEYSDNDDIDGDSNEESSVESALEGDIADESGSESSSCSDHDEGDEVIDEAAEETYQKQLQNEEFESELRKLTMEAIEKGKVAVRTGAGGKVSSHMPAAPQFIAKKQVGDHIPFLPESESSAASQFVSEDRMAFKLLKRGNKGKQEEVQLFVPKNTNLARRATKQDDTAAKERDLLKARVLQYEAESADAGGNVYLDETKLQVIRNRPLTIETIDRNFGKNIETPSKGPIMQSLGRGRGRGRLFNPGGKR